MQESRVWNRNNAIARESLETGVKESEGGSPKAGWLVAGEREVGQPSNRSWLSTLIRGSGACILWPWRRREARGTVEGESALAALHGQQQRALDSRRTFSGGGGSFGSKSEPATAASYHASQPYPPSPTDRAVQSSSRNSTDTASGSASRRTEHPRKPSLKIGARTTTAIVARCPPPSPWLPPLTHGTFTFSRRFFEK